MSFYAHGCLGHWEGQESEHGRTLFFGKMVEDGWEQRFHEKRRGLRGGLPGKNEEYWACH